MKYRLRLSSLIRFSRSSSMAVTSPHRDRLQHCTSWLFCRGAWMHAFSSLAPAPLRPLGLAHQVLHPLPVGVGCSAPHRKERLMTIGRVQFYLLIVAFTAVAGWRRGWVREVITCTIILATLLFLTLGGADLLANLLGGHGLGLVPTASAHPLYPAGGGNPNGGGLPGQPPAPGTSGGVSASTACPTNV